MSEVQQIREDLQYVRGAVARREQTENRAPMLLYIWAVYVIIGYSLMDFRIEWAGPFFAIGGGVGGILSWIIGRTYARRTGEVDRTTAIKGTAHFGGGIMLACLLTIMFNKFVQPLPGFNGSQVFVGMIGLVYFLWGVHYQRYFVLLGIVVMAGAIAVGFVPHFGWTILGAVISLGLILPTLIPARKIASGPAGSTAPGGQA